MSTVICTLGMHRSGTSMVSRLLNLAGVSLGSDRSVQESGADNPTGYWEHAQFRRINDALLDRFGGQWHHPPDFPADWLSDPVVGALAQEARAIVHGEFGSERVWGWKDPRTCLTLPFWQAVVGPMRYVICLRNPRDVAASLGLRNGLDAGGAEAMWLAYMEQVLRHTAGQPRLFVDYDAVLAHPVDESCRIARFAGLAPHSENDALAGRAVEAFITPALRHHDAASRSHAHDTPASFAAASLYLVLREAAGAGAQLPDEELARYATVARAGAAQQATAAAEAAAVRERNIALVDDAAGLRARVLQLEARCDAYEHENQVVRRTITDIHGSSAWRLVTAWRRMTSALLPRGSRRQAAVAGAVGRLAGGPDPSTLPAVGAPDTSD